MKHIRINTLSISNLTKKKIIILQMFLYKLLLEMVYYFAVSPLYSYMKLTWDPDWSAYLWSLLFAGFVAFSLPADTSKASFCCCLLYDCISIIPVICLYWMTSQRFSTVAIVVTFDVLIHIIIGIRTKRKYYKCYFNFTNHKKNFIFLQVLFYIYVLLVLYLVAKRGLDARVLSFIEDKAIYEVRGETRFTRVTAYLFNWMEKALFPFFLSISLYKKNKINICIILGCQILLFLSYGYKLSLFSIFFVFGIYVILKINKKNSLNILTSFSAAMIVTVMFYNANTDILHKLGVFLTSFGGMMTLFFPAFIKFKFFDFFENHPFIYFSEGLIGKIFGLRSPYGKTIGFVMSEWVNGSGGNWNTGIVSDAYANLGLLGIVIIAVIAGISLRVLDSATNDLPNYIKATAICMYPIYMNDNGLLTTLVTNGLVLMILLLSIYNSAYADKHG